MLFHYRTSRRTGVSFGGAGLLAMALFGIPLLLGLFAGMVVLVFAALVALLILLLVASGLERLLVWVQVRRGQTTWEEWRLKRAREKAQRDARKNGSRVERRPSPQTQARMTALGVHRKGDTPAVLGPKAGPGPRDWHLSSEEKYYV